MGRGKSPDGADGFRRPTPGGSFVPSAEGPAVGLSDEGARQARKLAREVAKTRVQDPGNAETDNTPPAPPDVEVELTRDREHRAVLGETRVRAAGFDVYIDGLPDDHPGVRDPDGGVRIYFDDLPELIWTLSEGGNQARMIELEQREDGLHITTNADETMDGVMEWDSTVVPTDEVPALIEVLKQMWRRRRERSI